MVLHDIDMLNINLKEKIISGSSFGCIWIGNYKSHNNVVIKIQSLRTGAYYDKITDQYYDINHTLINKSEAIKKYYRESIAKYFAGKKSITIEEFLHETTVHTFMYKNRIAPKIYDYGITKFINGLQYAIIIMKKYGCSLKRAIELNTNLKDHSLVVSKIKKMHELGYAHCDLQTSNIVVNLNDDGKIVNCKIIDWFFSHKIIKQHNIDNDIKYFIKRGGIWL